MILKMFSRAMYSTWGYYAPARTLFDCGEGCATALTNSVFGPERIVFGHSHNDHILGLPAFISSRNFAKGATNKPLAVYAPDSREFDRMKKFVREANSQLAYELAFFDVRPGFSIPITDTTRLEAFAVSHGHNSVGYKLVERRRRLKEGISPFEAHRLKNLGTEVTEEYEHPTFVWLLDSCTFDLKHIADADHVVFDTTFLNGSDDRRSEDPKHASMDEALAWAVECRVRRATLAHISTRYEVTDSKRFAAEEAARRGYTGKLDVVTGDRIYDIGTTSEPL